MSDRIAVMQSGEMVQVGSPDEIYRRPVNRFVAEFIGDPPANIVACRVAVDGGRVTASTDMHPDIDLGHGDPGTGKFELIVRPHHFQLLDQASDGAVPSRVRLIENFGAEHVYHVEYGDQLVAVLGKPDRCREGQEIWLGLDSRDLLLLDASTDRTIRLESQRNAA